MVFSFKRVLLVGLMEDLSVIPLTMGLYPIPYKSYLYGVAERDYIGGLDFYPLHFGEKKKGGKGE